MHWIFCTFINEIKKKNGAKWTILFWSNSLWTDHSFFFFFFWKEKEGRVGFLFYLKEDFLTTVCCLNTAIICQERLSPLAVVLSLASTAQHTSGATVARSHQRPALSWLSPGLPGHLLQKWCFPMVGNYYSLQKCEYEPKIFSFSFTLLKKAPLNILLDYFISTFCGIIRSSQEILVFPSLTKLLIRLLNYFPTQE